MIKESLACGSGDFTKIAYMIKKENSIIPSTMNTNPNISFNYFSPFFCHISNENPITFLLTANNRTTSNGKIKAKL